MILVGLFLTSKYEHITTEHIGFLITQLAKSSMHKHLFKLLVGT